MSDDKPITRTSSTRNRRNRITLPDRDISSRDTSDSDIEKKVYSKSNRKKSPRKRIEPPPQLDQPNESIIEHNSSSDVKNVLVRRDRRIPNTQIVHSYRKLGDKQGTARLVTVVSNDDEDLDVLQSETIFRLSRSISSVSPITHPENAALGSHTSGSDIELIKTTGSDVDRLHVITLSTDSKGPVENWEYTAKKHGYNYTILGRGEKWGGWPWRTSQYIEAVRRLEDDAIVMLCDGNDLFFVREPDVLMNAYRSYDTDLLFGGEPTCCTGKFGATSGLVGLYNRDIAIRKINDRNPPTRWCFPNAGCILGSKKRVLAALEDVRNEKDDQAGYLAKYLENPSYLTIDYHSRMVGNINAFASLYCVDCGLLDDRQKYESQFWRPVNNLNLSDHTLYENMHTGELPAVLHFPGKNTLMYNYIGFHMFPGSFVVTKPKSKSPLHSTKLLSSIADLWK